MSIPYNLIAAIAVSRFIVDFRKDYISYWDAKERQIAKLSTCSSIFSEKV